MNDVHQYTSTQRFVVFASLMAPKKVHFSNLLQVI